MTTKIRRDKFGQQVGEWSDFDYDLLSILEEISTDLEHTDDPDKSLAAYMTDIKDLFARQGRIARPHRGQ